MKIEIIIKLFSPFFVLWEKAVCFKEVSLDPEERKREGAGRRRRKMGKGVRREGKRGSQKTGWKETSCSNFLFKRRKSQRQSKIMH